MAKPPPKLPIGVMPLPDAFVSIGEARIVKLPRIKGHKRAHMIECSSPAVRWTPTGFAIMRALSWRERIAVLFGKPVGVTVNPRPPLPPIRDDQ